MSFNSILLRIAPQKSVLQSLKCLPASHRGCLSSVIRSQYSTDDSTPVQAKSSEVVVSKAMKAYLERAREHDEFMRVKQEEFNIGKRHLANMMGEDPETFTQENVDEAIAYLFPSALFDKKARPFMKPPEEVYPQRKAAEFDESGRPHHTLFYTGKANFYDLLHNIAGHIAEMLEFEERMMRKQAKVDPALQLDLNSSQYVSKDALEKLLVEPIADNDYRAFVTAMDRLASLPYSYRVKDFIFKYRCPLITQENKYEIVPAKYDADGRMYVTTYECLRKRARGDVTVRSPGTGKISINGQDISYFRFTQPREQVLFPLTFANMVGKVDVEANVEGGGFSGQAGAIRWGIAMCLRTFVDAETVARMRLAGLLQRDYRRKERKKPGQEGARRKFTWKKR